MITLSRHRFFDGSIRLFGRILNVGRLGRVSRKECKLSDEHSAAKGAKKLPSLLEKLADARFLVLMLSFFCYLDIWLLQSGVDPTKIALQAGYEALKNLSVFSAVLFVLSYSLLMAGFFPVLRKIIGLARLYVRSSVTLSNRSPDGQRLSDWSIAFIVLSAYDLILGCFTTAPAYRGLSMFVLDFLQYEGVAAVVFRLCVVFLWLACLALSFEVDDPSPRNA